MAIPGYTKEEFGTTLSELVYPSQPIHTIEHLFGRNKELDQIEKALYASGRHVFIYGDRGVGKSSLAATAANQYQSSDSEYIGSNCIKVPNVPYELSIIYPQSGLSLRLMTLPLLTNFPFQPIFPNI